MQFGFGAVVVVLLIVGVVAYRSVIASTESARWAQHTSEVLEQLANLRLAMENIESGYRDFALSGDDAFLQLSRARVSLVDQEQSALRALTADNPNQQRRLVIITDLVQRIIQRGDAMVQLRRTGGTEPAAELIRNAQGDPILDQFRAVARDMGDDEQGLLQQRNANEARRYHQARVTLILGSVLALLIAAVSGWMVPRDHADRREVRVAEDIAALGPH
jgi:CHASE3 domain sensor protein